MQALWLLSHRCQLTVQEESLCPSSLPLLHQPTLELLSLLQGVLALITCLLGDEEPEPIAASPRPLLAAGKRGLSSGGSC